MAQATRCPHCQSAFRVVRDQLLLRQGWVRCGHCGQAFNALDHLFDAPSARATAPATPSVPPPPRDALRTPSVAATPAAPPSTPAGAAAATAPTTDSPPAGAARDDDAGDEPLALDAWPPAAPPRTTPAAQALPEDEAEAAAPASEEIAEPNPASHAPEPDWRDVQTAAEPDLSPAAVGHVDGCAGATAASQLHAAPTAAETKVDDTAATREAGAETDTELTASDDATDPLTRLDLADALNYRFAPENAAAAAAPAAAGRAVEPEFLRRDRRLAFWRSTPVRLALAAIALLLALLAAAQAAWFWRDDLAQRWPQSRPWLQRLCDATTGCLVGAPRDLQALVIDASSLTPAEPGLRLHVLLRNRSVDRAVAYPALELTLLDLQGQIRARKVLLPAQYLPPAQATPQALAAGIAAGQQISVEVRLQVQGAAPAGYRVLAFYP